MLCKVKSLPDTGVHGLQKWLRQKYQGTNLTSGCNNVLVFILKYVCRIRTLVHQHIYLIYTAMTV